MVFVVRDMFHIRAGGNFLVLRATLCFSYQLLRLLRPPGVPVPWLANRPAGDSGASQQNTLKQCFSSVFLVKGSKLCFSTVLYESDSLESCVKPRCLFPPERGSTAVLECLDGTYREPMVLEALCERHLL